jgi:hypothetical protein
MTEMIWKIKLPLWKFKKSQNSANLPIEIGWLRVLYDIPTHIQFNYVSYGTDISIRLLITLQYYHNNRSSALAGSQARRPEQVDQSKHLCLERTAYNIVISSMLSNWWLAYFLNARKCCMNCGRIGFCLVEVFIYKIQYAVDKSLNLLANHRYWIFWFN